jgi:hypothetical protein
MSATRVRFARRLAMAALVLVASASIAEAQNVPSKLTLVATNSGGSPTGADFVAGFWTVATYSYTGECGSKPKCVIRINTSGTLTKPAGAVTQIQFSADGSPFANLPSTPTAIGMSFTGTKTGTIVIRYPLGWAGTTTFTPASPTPYSQAVQFNIQQGQP